MTALHPHSWELFAKIPYYRVWAYLVHLEQFPELEPNDLELLKQELVAKVTCHG